MLAPFPVSLPARRSSQPPKKLGQPANTAHPGPSTIDRARPSTPEPHSVPSSPAAEQSLFSRKSIFLRKRTASLSTVGRPGPVPFPSRDPDDLHGPAPARPPRNPARKTSKRPSTSSGVPHDTPAKAAFPLTSPSMPSSPLFVRFHPHEQLFLNSCSLPCFSLFPISFPFVDVAPSPSPEDCFTLTRALPPLSLPAVQPAPRLPSRASSRTRMPMMSPTFRQPTEQSFRS